jgi:NAD(P)H-hydrate epimerase
MKFPAREEDTHKGDYGHTLVLAGSVGMTGAAYLCAQAALLSGSGLVTLGIPKSLNAVLEVKLTEVMTRPLPETGELSLSLEALDEVLELSKKVSVAAIGPGLSLNCDTASLVKRLIELLDKPIVLDADGLNNLAGEVEVLKRKKADIVITPHPGELARLLELSPAEIQKNREKQAKNFSSEYGLVVVLKGYKTVVAGPDGQLYVNDTGNPGMASGGVGDVLTGMIAAFLGQGDSPFEASKKGVYLHGLAGDLAKTEKGEICLIATDILEKLPEAIKSVPRTA